MMKTYTLLGALRTVLLILAAVLAGWMSLALLLCVPLGTANPYFFSVVGIISLIALGFAAMGLLFGALKNRIDERIDRETRDILRNFPERFQATLDQIAADAQMPLAR